MCQALKNSKLKSLRILKQNASQNQNFGLENSNKLATFGKHIEKLEIIDDRINLDPEDVNEISKIKTLKSVKISYFTEKSLVNFAKNCHKLETLSIGRIIDLIDSFESLAQAFDTFFEERRYSLKKFSTLHFYESKFCFRNIHVCQNLEELVIKVRFLNILDCESISQLKGLKKLMIMQAYSIDDSNLRSIIENIDVAYLKSLILVGYGDTNGKLFETISKKHFPALERLYIKSSGYSDQAVQELVRNCPNLKSAQLYVLHDYLNYQNSWSKSISIHTLIDNSIKNKLYIDFGALYIYYGPSAIDFASLNTKLSKYSLDLWMKYQDLKRNFEEWCNDNMWSYKNESGWES